MDNEIKSKIVSLVSQNLDWDYLMSMASHHRLMPLLYYSLISCPENVPKKYLKQMKEEFEKNIHKNLLLTSELLKILELLKSNNINAISYKGPFLADLIYKNIGLRVFNDIDILINKSDALKTKKLMLSLGYELYPPINIEDDLYQELDCEYRFLNFKKKVMVEINWKFEGIFFSFPKNPGFLFEDINKINFKGKEIFSLSKENYFLMLCIHSAKHDWNRLSWICDIFTFLENFDDINWAEVLLKAEKLSVKKLLLINLILVNDLFGLNLPDVVLNDLNFYPYNKMSNQIKKRIFVNNNPLNIIEKLILDLNKRDSLYQGIKDSFNSLTKPSYLDFKYLPLPRLLFPLYFIIRPILLLKRYNKQI